MSSAETMLKVSSFIVIGLVLVGLAVPNQGIPLTGDTGTPQGIQNETDPETDGGDGSLVFKGWTCTVGIATVAFFGGIQACKAFVNDLLGSDSGIAQVATMAIGAIQQLMNALAAFFTFDVPGAPGWVRVLIAVPLNITLLYLIIEILPTT